MNRISVFLLLCLNHGLLHAETPAHILFVLIDHMGGFTGDRGRDRRYRRPPAQIPRRAGVKHSLIRLLPFVERQIGLSDIEDDKQA